MADTSHMARIRHIQMEATATKAYMDGIAEAVEDALNELNDKIEGIRYDAATENLTIPSSFCDYDAANENLLLY